MTPRNGRWSPPAPQNPRCCPHPVTYGCMPSSSRVTSTSPFPQFRLHPFRGGALDHHVCVCVCVLVRVLQAANSADYAIGQFRFLKRLLLVHGECTGHASRVPRVFCCTYIGPYCVCCGESPTLLVPWTPCFVCRTLELQPGCHSHPLHVLQR